MKRLPILAIIFLSIAFLTSVSFGQVNETKNSKEKVNSQVSSTNSKSVQVQNNSGSYQKQNKPQSKNGNGQNNGTAVRKLDGSGNKQAVRNSDGSGVRKYDGSGNGKGNRKGNGDCDKNGRQKSTK